MFLRLVLAKTDYFNRLLGASLLPRRTCARSLTGAMDDHFLAEIGERDPEIPGDVQRRDELALVPEPARGLLHRHARRQHG